MSIKQNPLPGVPDVESPFVEQLFSEESVPPEMRSLALSLARDGYAVIDFPDEDIATVADRIRANLHGQYDWAARAAGRGGDMRLQDAWKFDDDVRRVAVNSNVIDLLSKLYGRKAWPFQTLNFPVGTQQHFHTDSVHFSSMPERYMCGVWVALEDIGEDQGPLIYYPGSHRWPVYTNEHIGYRPTRVKTTQAVYEGLWTRLVEVSGIEPQRLTIKKGQALIWLANLLHGGDVHLDQSKTRWSQVTHYFFEGCTYYTPMNSDIAGGLIELRRPYNIILGERADNSSLGRALRPEFVEAVSAASYFAGEPEEDFDSVSYLIANPDVAAAGEDAYAHWIKHGRMEGRPLRPG